VSLGQTETTLCGSRPFCNRDALAYGGNGITFSLIAAEMISDDLLGRRNACSGIFVFERRA
jgi:hypothetical protein